ncbi:MAG: Fe-S cluster assembly protein SufD [Nitratiruptor sp.]|nr:Fe-S cluster assembly protein SufD [Nitratiruptor sp.]NPA84080.1 Fe-S cluster assembly protein SufD [Campylobacterota bacterium]
MKPIALNLDAYSHKKAIVQKLRSMGMPTPKTEHYRYFGIKPILERDYTFLPPEPGAIEPGDHLEIVDGRVAQAPKGLYIEHLPQVRVDDSHYDQIYYISHLLAPATIQIEIEEDMELPITHKFTQNGAFIPYRIKFLVHEGVKFKIKEEMVVVSEGSLYFYGYDIQIAPKGEVRLVSNRVTNIEDFALFGSHSIEVGKEATFTLFTFDLGNAKTIHNYHTILHERASHEANHVIFAKRQARLGNTFHIEHRGKEATTTQRSRNILKDRGRGIFDGLLIVKNPAKFASITQSSKTILLNDGAYMVSKPQMEIYTEYITQASHGSTTGHLDEEALFYLRQRGIALEEAKEMLVLSFLEEIFTRLGDEELRREFIAIYEERQ